MSKKYFEDINFSTSADASANAPVEKKNQPLPEMPAASQATSYEEFNKLLDSLKQAEATEVENKIAERQDLSDALIVAQEKASLSGRFNPDSLFPGNIPEAVKTFVLSSLSCDCIIESFETVNWMMTPAKRVEVLNRLTDAGEALSSRINDLPPTDEFGEQLRNVILYGFDLPLQNLQQQQLEVLVTVLQAIAPVRIPKPNLVDVTSRITSNVMLNDAAAFSKGFIGRQTEYAALLNFLQAPPLPKPTGATWDGLILTGLGGVGKSALLAKFTYDVLEQHLATVITLDFDRPAINPSDTWWLDSEISRQVGMQYPNLKLRLLADRNETYAQQGSFVLEGVLESNRGSQSMIYDVSMALQALPDQRPVLLILDTVEEVSQRFQSGSLLEWLKYVDYSLAPLVLKVIISGRLYDDQLDEFKNDPSVANSPLELKEFDQERACRFLEQQGLTNSDAQRFIETGLFPLRPLELKLIARLLVNKTVTMDALIEDLENGRKEGTTDELFAGLIYQRVLLRLNDPLISTIAFPGLVLRYVNAAIIQHVLQPALNLPPISEAEAEKVAQKLLTFTWLANRDDQGRIWHRKDLRRSSLKLMIAQNQQEVKQIREKAIAWFQQRDTEEARAEIIYHQLMMATTPEAGEGFDLSQLNAASKYIESNMPDLPKPASVLLRFAMNIDITEAEVTQLPFKHFIKVYEKTGRGLFNHRQFTKAYELYSFANKKGFILRPRGKGVNDKWEREILFNMVAWEEMLALPSFQESFNDDLISELVTYIYPAAFIDPDLVDRNRLNALLEKTFITNDKEFIKGFSGPESLTRLTRISNSLVILHCQKSLPEQIIKGIDNIIELIRSTNFSFPALGANMSIIDKNLLVLSRITERKLDLSFRLSPAAIRFDAQWVRELVEFLPDQDHLITEMAALFEPRTVPISARQLLVEMDASKNRRKDLSNSPIRLSGLSLAKIYSLVKGPDPHFRDLCRYALLESFTTPEAYKQLAILIQFVIKVRLEDLEPDRFATEIATNTEFALEPFVEIIDRSWAMGDFLRLVASGCPPEAKIQQVLHAYEMWEEALKLVITVEDGPIVINKPIIFKRKTTRQNNASNPTQMETTTTTTMLAQNYRKKMRGGSNSLLESTTESTVDFSDAAIKERTDTTKVELYRIIRDYLGNEDEYYKLVDEMVSEGSDALKAVANDDDSYLASNPQKTNLLEVIVRTDGSRPSFMVRNGVVDKATSPLGTWGNLLDASADRLNEAIACVGRVNLGELQVGTGFLIHKNLLITNRHVLQLIATFENNGQWQLKPGALIDFGYEFRARQSVNPRKLKRIVFCGPQFIDSRSIDHNKLDLALIELEPAAPEEIPQRLLSFFAAPEWAEVDATIFTIGYPANPGWSGVNTYNNLLEQLFRTTYGCKRLAPGVITPSASGVNPWRMSHDATTLGGNSGSVILVAGREYAAAGLHYGGTLRAPRENWGHILGLTMSTADATGKTLKDHLNEFGVAITDVI